MSKVIRLTGLTVREYAEQRKWDHFHDDEEERTLPFSTSLRDQGKMAAYQDILNFLDEAYRPEFLENVADRIARRKLVGPHRG